MKRPGAKEALRHPWLSPAFHEAKQRPLSSTVVQRIQRFAQNNVVRRTILELIAQASLGEGGMRRGGGRSGGMREGRGDGERGSSPARQCNAAGSGPARPPRHLAHAAHGRPFRLLAVPLGSAHAPPQPHPAPAQELLKLMPALSPTVHGPGDYGCALSPPSLPRCPPRLRRLVHPSAVARPPGAPQRHAALCSPLTRPPPRSPGPPCSYMAAAAQVQAPSDGSDSTPRAGSQGQGGDTQFPMSPDSQGSGAGGFAFMVRRAAAAAARLPPLAWLPAVLPGLAGVQAGAPGCPGRADMHQAGVRECCVMCRAVQVGSPGALPSSGLGARSASVK